MELERVPRVWREVGQREMVGRPVEDDEIACGDWERLVAPRAQLAQCRPHRAALGQRALLGAAATLARQIRRREGALPRARRLPASEVHSGATRSAQHAPEEAHEGRPRAGGARLGIHADKVRLRWRMRAVGNIFKLHHHAAVAVDAHKLAPHGLTVRALACPEAAIGDGGVVQREPQPDHRLPRRRVQESGILVRGHHRAVRRRLED
eukprot:6775850-Prymnesium_polylepis.1